MRMVTVYRGNEEVPIHLNDLHHRSRTVPGVPAIPSIVTSHFLTVAVLFLPI